MSVRLYFPPSPSRSLLLLLWPQSSIEITRQITLFIVIIAELQSNHVQCALLFDSSVFDAIQFMGVDFALIKSATTNGRSFVQIRCVGCFLLSSAVYIYFHRGVHSSILMLPCYFCTLVLALCTVSDSQPFS